ncbi:glutamine synthetase family protein [Fodinibius salsisoli]|uniref:Glutamine synthetase n=1 Tax=Fodinibius salsisoli TaxID=2820877 RepID=A0ABT3PML3_9BACT|nr:glutamine synthetase family protein [Fodinibius salsisoli]MCW9707177.1 glutamine synthetase [Fodinibius salsisoli]
MVPKDVVQKIETYNGNKIKFAVVDIDGVLRGKVISKDKFLKGLDSGIGFCDVVFGWDINDAVYGNSQVTGWHTGYPDAEATIDPSTYRTIPWEKDTPFFLADFSQSDDFSEVCPRTLLKKIRGQCQELGYKAVFANEFEWFNFRETPQTLHDKDYHKPTPLTPGMFGYSILRSSQNASFFNDLYDQLHDFGIPLEGQHTETGDGVYEASIAYTDVLKAADRASLFKSGVKEIAYKHEIIASFMAKWNKDLPGCSGHIHQSLWDRETNKNIFYDAEQDAGISKLLEQYIAGQLYCLPHILPMYAPSINSYKRYVEGSWASTTVSWGIGNRTTALRVITPDESSARLETRVPGSDANPYLSMAASLASGLYGIRNELSLDIPMTEGNEYDNSGNRPLPTTLKEATEAMKSSELSQELFGETFVDHFIRTREWEWKQFSKQVTDWELKRYFEII